MDLTCLPAAGPSVSRGACPPPSWPAWAPTWSPRFVSTTGSPTGARRKPSDTSWPWTRPTGSSQPLRLTQPWQRVLSLVGPEPTCGPVPGTVRKSKSDYYCACCPGVKYSQQMLCDVTGSSARGGGGGDRGVRLVVSPVQLEPSQTLLENHKQVRSQISQSHTRSPYDSPNLQSIRYMKDCPTVAGCGRVLLFLLEVFSSTSFIQ